MKRSLLRIVVLSLMGILLEGCDDTYWWPRDRFDSAAWKATSENERYRFARDILDRKIFIGMDVPEVENALGEPSSPLHLTTASFKDDPPKFYYQLYGLSCSNGEGYVLDIRYTEDTKTVYKTFIRRDSC